MTSRHLIIGALSFLCLGVPSYVTAQPPSAEIAGFVRASDGAGLPGARITVRQPETGREWFAVAGGRGVYRVPDLPAGRYDIRAELERFESQTKPDVVLSAGERRTLDFTLAVATIREIVTVVATLPRDTLEATEARESSARDVGEALARNAGVSKLRKGGIANDVVLRGFQSKDLNVLIDGQRIYGACPNHMDPPAFHVDFSEVERIEIGKGPFDVRNQGSLGGVVNIITRSPERGFHAAGNFAAGSYGFLNPSATTHYANDRFSALGGFSYRQSEPYTDGSGKLFTQYANYRASALESDSFRVGTAWAGFSASPAEHHLVQISYTRQQADHVLYPYLQMDAVYDDTDRINFGYQVNSLQGPFKSLRVQSYYAQVRHWMTDEYRMSSVNMPRTYSMGTFATTRTVGGKFETSLQDLTIGFEAFNRFWSTATQLAGMAYKSQASIPDVDSLSVGVYADYRRSLSDRARIEFGGRLDRTRTSADPSKANTDLYFAYNSTRSTSATDVYPSGNVRLTYTLPSGLELSGGGGHTVRAPDAVERYFALRRAGSDWVGNPGLEPSRNTGADGSVSFRRQGLFVTGSFFSNWISDYVTVRGARKINPVTGIMNVNARSYENVDAQIYGSEVQLVYSLTRRLFFSSGLTCTRGLQDPEPNMGILSEDLAEMPPLASRAGLRFDTGRFFAEAEGVFAGAQHNVDTDLREQPTAGYGIANIRIGANLKRFVMTFGLNNIFDRLFREHLSYQRDPFRSGVQVFEPGRNVFLNLSYRF